MVKSSKDTIYIDVDDEITSIVDKIQGSDSKIVALVLPKRAVALQSIVNMKLLKSSAEEAGKSPVLITSEAGLLPLAGATGLYVAKNLTSKPEIPDAPEGPESVDEEITAEVEDDQNASNAAVAAGAVVGAVALDDTIDLDKEPDSTETATKAAAGSAKKASKKKGAKNQKIPNFEKFRKKLFIIVGGIIALIVLWYLAVFVAPKANIVIETNTESLNSNFEFTASPSATEVNVKDSVIPAKLAEKKKEDSQTTPATGQKDMGAKASGTVTVKNCGDTAATVSSGSGLSSNNLTFIAQSTISLTSGNFDSGGNCKTSGSHVGSVKVVAQNNGDQYNLASGSTYSVAGSGSSVTGSGSAMTGGSSKIAKVVSEQDVETAKKKIDAKDDIIKTELQGQLESQGYYVLKDSFKKTNETTVASPDVGSEASEVKVTYSADFTMVGIKRDDLKKLIEESLKDEIDTNRQKIQEDGLDTAKFVITKTADNGDRTVTVETSVTVGPDIDTEKLKNDIAGKKSGETENLIKELPGVKEARVDYSPFWVMKTPKKVSKITIEFKSAGSN